MERLNRVARLEDVSFVVRLSWGSCCCAAGNDDGAAKPGNVFSFSCCDDEGEGVGKGSEERKLCFACCCVSEAVVAGKTDNLEDFRGGGLKEAFDKTESEDIERRRAESLSGEGRRVERCSFGDN